MAPDYKNPEQIAHEIIDRWIEDLIIKITSVGSDAPKRDLWDRFKGGLYNLFIGRTGKTAEKYNPYYWRNRFGDDLGVEESRNLTLSDYATIKSAVLLAESRAAEGLVISEAGHDKLRIVMMLRAAAEDLKKRLAPVLSKYSAPISDEAGVDPPKEKAPEKPDEVSYTDPVGVGRSRSSEPASTNPAAISEPDSASGAKSSSAPDVPSKPRPRPSFAGTLHDAMMFRRNKEVQRPTPEWTDGGKLVPEQLPAVIAWLTNNPGIDVSKDDEVERELKEKLSGFIGMEKHNGGNSLVKSFLEKGSQAHMSREFLLTKLLGLGVDPKVLKKLEGEDKAGDSEDSSLEKALEDMLRGKTTKEEVLNAVKEGVVSKLISNLKLKRNEKGRVLRLWDSYCENASPNLEELKESIIKHLANTIMSWGLVGVDEELLKKVATSG